MKYLITKEQVAEQVKVLETQSIDNSPFGQSAIDEAISMLQSLPVLEGEPVAWRRFDDTDIAWHVELTTNDDYDEWQPLYTHPSPTQLPLTDEQCLELSKSLDQEGDSRYMRDLVLIRATESAHKIGVKA